MEQCTYIKYAHADINTYVDAWMNANNDRKKGRKEETDGNKTKAEWKTEREELNKRRSRADVKIEIRKKEHPCFTPK